MAIATTEKMFINARNSEELRIAIVKDHRVNDVFYEHPGQELQKGNICKAKITHREKSLNAVFAKYSDQEGTRDGFLPKNEILPEYFHNPQGKSFDQLSVEDIPEGLEIIVQVDKEERGTKGAALTTYISLAGRYLVLMPQNPGAGGISRRIEGEDRSELREVLNQLQLPEDAGAIIRTAGVGKSLEDLQWDLDVLLKIWLAIFDLSKSKAAPFLIYQESDIIGRVVRDYLRQGISEIWVDTKEAWEKVRQYVLQLQPDFIDHVKLYDEIIPLFNRYHIEPQLEATFERVLELPNRGNIVIDHTEALVSIDVNSAKATRGRDIEETARLTNLDAAKEVARQLRLRDINGIVIIDFIDMAKEEHKREVENTLREEVKHDRARIQIGRISKIGGVLEMSRQRLRPSLKESSTIPCPRCRGQGRIRAIESLALAILRLLSEEAINKKVAQIEAQLPVPVANYLLNEKRADLYEIQSFYQTKVILVANEFIETPHYRIVSRSKEELKERASQASYRLVERPLKSFEHEPHSVAIGQSEPALKTVALGVPVVPRSKPNLFRRIFGSIGSIFSEADSGAHPSSSEGTPSAYPAAVSDGKDAEKETPYGPTHRRGSGGTRPARKNPRENQSSSFRSDEGPSDRGADSSRGRTTTREQAGPRQNFNRDRYDRRKPKRYSSSTQEASLSPVEVPIAVQQEVTHEAPPVVSPVVYPSNMESQRDMVVPTVSGDAEHIHEGTKQYEENLPVRTTTIDTAKESPEGGVVQEQRALAVKVQENKVERETTEGATVADVGVVAVSDAVPGVVTTESADKVAQGDGDERANRSRRYPRSHGYNRRQHHARPSREALPPVIESKQESFFNNEEGGNDDKGA